MAGAAPHPSREGAGELPRAVRQAHHGQGGHQGVLRRRASFVMSGAGPTRIVILGGGFGGVYAALELEKALARDESLKATLVARENFFLFTPMLHEVAASDLDMTHIVNPIRKLLRRVKFVQGEVESVDLGRRRV